MEQQTSVDLVALIIKLAQMNYAKQKIQKKPQSIQQISDTAKKVTSVNNTADKTMDKRFSTSTALPLYSFGIDARINLSLKSDNSRESIAGCCIHETESCIREVQQPTAMNDNDLKGYR